MPDELFQDENIVKVFKNIINFIIKKNETTFLIENISNNKLKYDLNYKFGKIYDFYFYMMKAYHDATNLFSIMCRLQSVIQKIYLKSVIFNDSKNKLEHIQILNRSFNVMGNISVDYKDKLDLIVKEIKDQRNWLKRTQINPPKGYNSQESLVLEEFNEMTKEIDERVLKLADAKEKIRSEIIERKFTFKKALDWWGRIRSLLP